MNGIENGPGANAGRVTSCRRQGLQLAPVTRAVRAALAVSATALALAGSGAAFAADGCATTSFVIRCTPAPASQLPSAVDDLTVVAVGADVEVDNDQDVFAVGFGTQVGIFAATDDGDAIVHNSGYIGAYSVDGIADGIFASGDDVEVDNSGEIVAIGAYWGAGIEAQGEDLTTVSNSGAIYASGFYGFGIHATGGDIQVVNDGDIEAQGYIANGIFAQGGGDIGIVNSGGLVAGTLYAYNGGLYGSLMATGIHAASNGAGAVVGIDNSGTIAATGYIGGIGIEAIAIGAAGSASVDNSGVIHASQYSKYGYGAAGIVVSADGHAGIDNSGLLAVESGGLAYGALALSFNGDATVVSSGDINVHSTGAAKYYGAYGIVAASQYGSAFVDNSGSVHVTSDYLDIGYIGMGIQAVGMDGATVTNSGGISVDAKYAYGIHAVSGAGDVSVTNADGGMIDVYSYFSAGFGTFGVAVAGDVEIDNVGTIGVEAYSLAVGAFARSQNGTALVTNGGSISVAGAEATAFGVLARGLYAEVVNNGSIEAYAPGNIAMGIYANGYGSAHVQNNGDIHATTLGGLAIGIQAKGHDEVSVVNEGDILASATDGTAIGIFATSYGDIHIGNSGTISTSQAGTGIAVLMDSLGGTSTVSNGGLVDGAIISIGGVDDIDEPATSGAGVDFVINEAGGSWLVRNFLSDLGVGDDTITNAGGGTIVLANGGIFLGDADSSNAFENAGLLQVSGYGLVHMGTADSVFANDGMVSLVDGGANDVFVIAGDLGGDGSMSFDANLATGAADLVYVHGDVVDGSSQAINLVVDGAPVSLSQTFELIGITGDASVASFTGGEAFGFDASNFLDLDVGVAMSRQDGFNILSASVEVAGLNDTGVLAASVAPGVHSLVGSSIGTWRQRVGVAPSLNDRVGLGPWVRFYADDGGVSPSASGFSAHSDFGFEQENRGREFGFNLPVGGGASLGLLAGTADGTQVLAGGTGSSRIDLDYSGLSGTWIARDFHVDASMRWLDFEAVLASAGDVRHTNGSGTAFNLEAGYTGWKLGAFELAPQVQYTRTRIDDIAPVSGSLVDFTADGGVSERVRLGLGISRAFASANGVRWTPYGAVSAVNEMDGESRYTVDGNALFSGTSSTDGTHALVEAGVGVQAGGLSLSGGLHWADGGALDGNTGGQLVLRYTW